MRDFSDTFSAAAVVREHFFPAANGSAEYAEALRKWREEGARHPDGNVSTASPLYIAGTNSPLAEGCAGTERSTYTYLGSPYAKYEHGLDEAARIVTMCAGVLMSRGWRIYCPITHGHAVESYQSLPRSWEFWKEQDQPFIDAAADLIVLKMKGWQDSVGLTYEIGEFERTGRAVSYLEPRSLGVFEKGHDVRHKTTPVHAKMEEELR